MKPHPRIRKAIKWGGAAVTVLLVVVWIGSGWYSPLIADKRFNPSGGGYTSNAMSVSEGCVMVTFAQGGEFKNVIFDFSWRPAKLRYRFVVKRFGHGWCVVVPVWAPTAVCLVACVTAWRLDTLASRRARLNLCPKCHYDRAGLAAGAKCPECGSAAP
jgi:hypothetical protein